MALVLSNQENIDLLLFWLRLAVGICSVAIAALVIFWLRLKNLEKRLVPKKNTTRHSPHLGKLPQSKTTRYLRSAHKRTFNYGRLPWRWLWAIASIAGVAIALGNGFIGSEITTFLWLLIGVILVVVAAFGI